MNPLRRPLLIFLDPRPPWWAWASVWCIPGFLLVIAARLMTPGGPFQWLRITLEVAGFIVILNAGLARILRQSQVNFHNKRLIRRGAGQCPDCGYNLKGLATGLCPECGTDIERATRESTRVVKPGD